MEYIEQNKLNFSYNELDFLSRGISYLKTKEFLNLPFEEAYKKQFFQDHPDIAKDWDEMVEVLSNDFAYRYKSALNVLKYEKNEFLIEFLNLIESDIVEIKKKLHQPPLSYDTIRGILKENNFTCCVCQGNKSEDFLVYNTSQEKGKNDYDEYCTSVVLCPIDYDNYIVNSELEHSIMKKKLLLFRRKWEKSVVQKSIIRSVLKTGEVRTIDYCNYDLIQNLFADGEFMPKLDSTPRLIKEGFICSSGTISEDFHKKVFGGDKLSTDKPEYYSGHATIGFYLYKLLMKAMDSQTVLDLNTLIKKTKSDIGEVEGKFCFYIGQIFGNKIEYPLSRKAPKLSLYKFSSPYMLEWNLDPSYMITPIWIHKNYSKWYFIIGKVADVCKKYSNGREYTSLVIEPLSLGEAPSSIDDFIAINGVKSRALSEINLINASFLEDTIYIEDF